jgi:hypothetical protein
VSLGEHLGAERGDRREGRLQGVGAWRGRGDASLVALLHAAHCGIKESAPCRTSKDQAPIPVLLPSSRLTVSGRPVEHRLQAQVRGVDVGGA